MINKIRDIYYDELEHEHRFMLSLIYAELIILMILKFWPAQVAPPEDFEYSYSEEPIYVEHSIATRQSSAPAAPPRPQIPVPVPNDEVIEEEINFPEFDEVFAELDADGTQGLSNMEGEGEIVGSPERPPGLIRIVEPTIPEAAKKANVKARIVVTFLVGTDGQVEDAFISEIRLYEGDTYRVVEQIGYGLMEATLEAALKWRFSPARNQGEPVKTYVENSFNIGF